MSLTRTIKEFEAHQDVTWPLPAVVTAEALALFRQEPDMQGLEEVFGRFIGVGQTPGAIVRAALAEEVPSDVWPFTHIDWEAAAAETDIVADGVCLGGQFWFDQGLA